MDATVTLDRAFKWALIVGTLLRILPLALWPEEACVRDECSYVRIAERIASGEGMTSYGGWLWAPGYPTFLAIHKAITGWCSPSKATQIGVSIVNMILLWRLGLRIAGPAPTRVAVWLYALSPSLVFYTISMWSETLYTTLFLGTFLALDHARTDARYVRMSILTGVLAGLLILFRGVALFMVPLWCLGLLWGRWRAPRGWISAALAVTFAAATVAPYSYMISTKYDAVIVSDRTLGQMMWLGNNDFEPITFDYGGPLSTRRFQALERRGREACAPRNAAIERDDCQTAEGFRWIEAHPDRFLMRIPQRLAQMLTPHSLLTRHLRWGAWRGIPPWVEEGVVAWGVAWTFLVVLGGAVGIALWGEGALSATIVAVTLYNLTAIAGLAGLSRYRAPLEPLFMIYCGMIAVDAVPSLLRARVVPWRGILALVLVVALIPLMLWYLPSGWPKWRSW